MYLKNHLLDLTYVTIKNIKDIIPYLEHNNNCLERLHNTNFR